MNEKIKDSGAKQEFETGAHRDNPIGKGRCDLLPLKMVAQIMNDPVVDELAEFMDTRDISHLACAIRNSVNTISCFQYSNIKSELKELGIETTELNTTDTSKSCDQMLSACLAHMMIEASKLYESGAIKYGANNWQLGMPVNRYIDSGTRHYLKCIRGDIDEPHYRAFVWNLLCAMWTAMNKPELNFSETPER